MHTAEKVLDVRNLSVGFSSFGESFNIVRDIGFDIRKGETVGGIAARYGVTVAMLRETNKIPKSNLIHPGDQLLIPMGGGLKPPQPRASGSRSTAVAAAPAGGNGDYTPPAGYERIQYDVRRGDTLSSIARRLGVTLDHLRLVNNLKRNSLIRPGQRLFAWRPS